nr:class C sortase [Lachnospiraceae bacterium]
MKKKRDIITTVVFGFIFLVGLSVMLYSTFSNWWNRNMTTHSITTYKEAVAEMDNDETEQILAEAHAYNEQLAQLYAPFTNFDAIPGYDDILNISGTGVMGYVS